ncbi:hypothetical protein NEHOM01_2300 [Nematocida homosporus]|uniref:uncharacterized protein n=1 Tax=Nematocida homosporus TaxID=1912981 RepID=UPI00221F90D0|nr:uncharacterized protein NEHOM01_2300 [Nematocida homosporus]KAI5187598.1 hypothetical protein NEHOM01_2300 [Nematocida homosporus]
MSYQKSQQNRWQDRLFLRFSRQIKYQQHKQMQAEVENLGLDLTSLVGPRQNSLLHVAARYNNVEAATYLLSKGCSIHQQNQANECPFYLAVRYRSKDVIRRLEGIKTFKILDP